MLMVEKTLVVCSARRLFDAAIGSILTISSIEILEDSSINSGCAVFQDERLSFDLDAGEIGHYSISLDLIASDPYIFQLDLNNLVSLTDSQCATFSGDVLTIPSIDAGELGVVLDVSMVLSDADTFQFTLVL